VCTICVASCIYRNKHCSLRCQQSLKIPKSNPSRTNNMMIKEQTKVYKTLHSQRTNKSVQNTTQSKNKQKCTKHYTVKEQTKVYKTLHSQRTNKSVQNTTQSMNKRKCTKVSFFTLFLHFRCMYVFVFNYYLLLIN
jgi:hypothetical protein